MERGMVLPCWRLLSSVRIAVVGLLLASPGLAAEKVLLEEPADDTRIFGIGMRVDVNGKVLTRGAENKPADLPLTVTAALSYRERRLVGLGSGAQTLRSVRDYEQAQVDLEIGDEKSTTKLPDALKLMVAQGQPAGLELYSLGGILSAQELELVTPPCDSLGFVALLPPAAVAEGEEWTPSTWVAPFLARFEASTSSSLKCRLVAVKNDIAEVSFTGAVKGAAQGTPAEVSLQGSLQFDLKQRCVVDAELVQTEKREIGAVTPGLDVTARLRILRKPAQIPGRVAEQRVIDAGVMEPPASALALRFESPWNLSLLHGRDWHLFQQTPQVAIFRLLDQGLFVAQCNLSPIPSAKPGEHTSEQVFQNDIQQSLGTRLKVMGAGEQIPSKEMSFVYRVTAEGAINDRPLTWIYYLLADASGRQASVLFAVDTPLLEKLGNRDREFVQSLRFGAPRTTSLLGAGTR